MKQIGFKNFRRFIDFPNIEFGDITLMVGRNNAGKSTVVKAILLILDYLKTQQGRSLQFDNNSLNDVNIVTFGRALCNSAERSEIEFNVVLDDFDIKIILNGEENYTSAILSSLCIADKKTCVELEISYKTNTISFKLNNNIGSNNQDIQSLDILEVIRLDIVALENQLESASSLNEKLQIQAEINARQTKYKKSISYNVDDYVSHNVVKIEYPINERIEENRDGNIILNYIDDFVKTNKSFISLIQGGTKEKSKNTLADMKYLNQHSSLINEFSVKLINTLNTNRFVYFAAHSTKQSALFSIRDKEAFLAQTIHEFYQLKILKGEVEYTFIQKWMNLFEVGSDFDIKPYASEAYTFSVLSENKFVYLGDKGMGSIQAMTLILRLATIIRKYRYNTKGILVIIEEPELNLHPALQSRLADLFYEINRDFGIRFIIETHSEYLVRKTQVIVASEKIFSDSPFTVYYFSKEAPPYQLKYLENGRFDEKFGEGFFDEAGKWNIELIKIERGV